jgi:hypothetical protein
VKEKSCTERERDREREREEKESVRNNSEAKLDGSDGQWYRRMRYVKGQGAVLPEMPGSYLAPPVPEACVGSEGVSACDTAMAVAPENDGSAEADMDRKQGRHDAGNPPGDGHKDL